MDNPFAVALIGAGIAWRLYKKPPVTTLLVGAGLASLMMSGGSRRGANRDPYRDPRRQGYVPGGVAGYGYPVEEDAPELSLTERAGAAASSVAERARAIGERARDAASTAAAHVSETARDVGERCARCGVHRGGPGLEFGVGRGGSGSRRRSRMRRRILPELLRKPKNAPG